MIKIVLHVKKSPEIISGLQTQFDDLNIQKVWESPNQCAMESGELTSTFCVYKLPQITWLLKSLDKPQHKKSGILKQCY